MSADPVQDLIDDATFDFTMGDHEAALAKLRGCAALNPTSFAVHHALAEILFSLRRFDEALVAADAAHAVNAEDLFINTTLSRIWMEKGDKPKAEQYGAKAKILGWKDQLKSGPATPGQVH